MQGGGVHSNRTVKLSKEGHIDWELKLLAIAFILCLHSFLQDYIIFYYFSLLFFLYINISIYLLNNYMRTAQASGGRWSYDDATWKLFRNTYLKALAVFTIHLFFGTTHSLLLAPTLSIISILEYRPCVMAINDKYPYLRELN